MGVLDPGTMLGGCRIDGVVGRGGMGVVYRARQLDLDRDVAVKVIAPELVEDPKTRTRFLTEARAAGAVEHPNVVPVHAAGIAEGRAYLVMRFVAGDDLRAIVQRDGPLTPAAAAHVMVQLGDALDAIHAAGYVHRDVKPRNVMLDESGHVYLSDFGLAKQALATAGPTTSEQWVGTLDYVAPEQIRGDPVDARADVYALGGVLFFVLTGRIPFDREGDHAKLWAHLHDPPPRPSDVRPDLPAGLDAVVQRALAKDPAQRHPSAGDLARAARAAVHGDADATRERTVAVGAAAPATTISARAPIPRRRRPRAAIAGAVLAGAAAVAIVLLATGGDPDPRRPARKAATAGAAPAGPRVGDTFDDVGFRPRGLTVLGGQVWVISNSRDRVARIDAGSGRRRGHQPEIGQGAASIDSDAETVWVARPSRHSVVGISPRTGNVIRHIDITQGRPARVAAGRSGLWIVVRTEITGEPDYLFHYDRTGTKQSTPIPFEDGVRAITLGGGYLWLALDRQQRLLRLRPGTTRPQHGGWLRQSASDLTYGAGYVWASESEEDVVERVNPRTTTAIGRPVDAPEQLAVADHRVFVASYTGDRVVVLDPDDPRAQQERIPVRLNPVGVAAGAGHVWVTSLAEHSLTRLDY